MNPLVFYWEGWLIINYYVMWPEKTQFEVRAWISIKDGKSLPQSSFLKKFTFWVQDHLKSLFYFCFSASGGYEKINAREESNSFVLSIAAYGS